MQTALDLPPRATKPRSTGLTMMIDNGLPLGQFADVVRSHGDLVDLVKFGWGTALLLFEAPTKALQTHFVLRFGSDVNLGNIASTDLVALETLRLGLRSDTMLDELPAYLDAPAATWAADRA